MYMFSYLITRCLLLTDTQPEQVYENTVEEITLGELDISSTAAETSQEMELTYPVMPKKIDLEIRTQPSPECILDTEDQTDVKKAKKKCTKKGQTKCECFFLINFKYLPYCAISCYFVKMHIFFKYQLRQKNLRKMKIKRRNLQRRRARNMNLRRK